MKRVFPLTIQSGMSQSDSYILMLYEPEGGMQIPIFIGASEDSGDFETAVIDPATERFYRVSARLTSNGLEIIDHARNTRHVVTSNPTLFNLVAREFQYNTSDASSSSQIETSSSAVIHLIDQPLMIQN